MVMLLLLFAAVDNGGTSGTGGTAVAASGDGGDRSVRL